MVEMDMRVRLDWNRYWLTRKAEDSLEFSILIHSTNMY
jgi:hypothetical protein